MIIVHHLDHMLAALRVAEQRGFKDTTLHSPHAAAAYGGADYFKAILLEASKAFPDIHISFVLDCEKFPGFVFGALRSGFKLIRYTGNPLLLKPLRAIAKTYNAEILDSPLKSPYLDLFETSNPERAIELYLPTAA